MTDNPLPYALLAVVAMILSSAVHEWAHAMTALKLGDDTPKREGRTTLNPAAHIDPIGTLVMPAVGAWIGGMLIGWAKPVRFQPTNFRRNVNMRRGSLLVAFAGPFSNLVLFFLCLVILKVVTLAAGIEIWSENPTVHAIGLLLNVSLFVNLILFFFNLLPAPPLDGYRILSAVLPADSKIIEIMEEYQLVFFIIAILIGFRLLAGPMFLLQQSAFEMFDIVPVLRQLQLR
jgi:Zn-dependent protease